MINTITSSADVYTKGELVRLVDFPYGDGIYQINSYVGNPDGTVTYSLVCYNEPRFMKHKIVVLVCLIAILGLGSYAAHLHHIYRVSQSRAAVAAQNARVKADQEAAQAEATFQAGVKLNEAQCAKDKAAYNLLTPTVKLKTSAPDCEVAIP